RGARPRGPGLPRNARVERGRHPHAPRAPHARAAIARRSRRGRRLHGLRLGAGARRDRARLGPVLGRAGKSAGSMKSASPRAALTAVVLSTVAANFTLTILSIALKPIAVELGSTVDAAGWLTVAPLLVSALVAPASGRASDRYGARAVWIGGSLVLLAGLVLSALAPSMSALIAARVVTGLGSGFAMSSGMAMATGAFPPDRRSEPVSAIMTASALSPAVGVLVGGPLIEYFGFRLLF